MYDSLNAIAASEALVATAEKTHRGAARSAAAANLRYSNGYSSYLEVLNAQRDFRRPKASVIDVKRARLQGVVALHPAGAATGQPQRKV